MEENLRQLLYKELNRMQSVIDVLLEQNALLKKTVYCYEQQLCGRENPLHPSFLQPVQGVHEALSSYITASDGQKIFSSSTLVCNEGGTGFAKPLPAEREGGKQVATHTPSTEGGRNNSGEPTPHTERREEGQFFSSLRFCKEGGKHVSHPVPLQEGGIAAPFAPIPVNLSEKEIEGLYLHESRSAFITYRQSDGALAAAQPANGLPANASPVAKPKEKKLNLPTAINNVKAVMPTSHNMGLENTVLILLHLQKAPNAPMKALRKVTGLSETGIEKRIIAMKKAGLITRPPGRRLLYLTSQAEQMLEEAKM